MNQIELTVNGKRVTGNVDDNTRLLDFLRDELRLTGTKEGCSVGECGACTVIMNGKTVCSCLVLAGQCDGAQITTVEALRYDPIGQRLQQEFVRYGGTQCGFCTPGFLMSAKALLDMNPDPDDDEIMDALEGNICRCTGYHPILQSIKAVIESAVPAGD